MGEYGRMPGAHDEGVRDNPPVKSKFDKSQGRGLPAPHLKHPGEVAKETGSKHPGFNENGHLLPKEGAMAFGGVKTHHHEPSRLGTNMADGEKHIYGMQNKDHVGHVSPGKIVQPVASMHLREPDPVDAGTIKERPATSGYGTPHGKGSESRYGSQVKSQRSHPQKMEDSSTRRRADAGALAGESGERRGYMGGRGKIKP